MNEIQVQMTVDFDEFEPTFEIEDPKFRFEDRTAEDRALIIARISAIHREKLYAAEALRRSAS